MAMKNNVIFYLPLHNNLSQTEHTAAFFRDHKGKLFFYEWNTSKDLMLQFYSSQKQWDLEFFDFSFEAIVKELQKDQGNANRVVILLTSSPNYNFGRAQRDYFLSLQKRFPAIVGVFGVGHCLYGCHSCGLHEHNVPVYFTRFFRHELPYNTASVKKLIEVQHQVGGKFRKSTYPSSVLIAPSVHSLSFLCNDLIIESLIQAQKSLNMVFVVKLHGFCFMEGHPLSQISQLEKNNVEKLKKNFVVVDQSQYCILPMLEAFDIIITDVDSSVAFESLYFSPKIILAYRRQTDDAFYDQEYFSYLRLFSDEKELTTMLHDFSKSNTAPPQNADARKFFEKKYGVVDGNEVERIMQHFGWKAKEVPKPITPTEADVPQIKNAFLEDINEVLNERRTKGDVITAADFLAMGMEVPMPIRAFERFVNAHKAQLEGIDAPAKLWMQVYEKLTFETFDAGNFVELHYDEEGYKLVAKVKMSKDDVMFLIDHAWSTDYVHARQQLRATPALLGRLSALMDLDAQADDEIDEQEGDDIEGDDRKEDAQPEEKQISEETEQRFQVLPASEAASAR
eukprot:TRINITY_DN5668_c0_g1_i1.p1 TRINITY_DN5668_c0_g1~~TRINITY_DN5668_c0_g1_i1.p1  ORF type:complete len:565 (-),score=145.59 TRINITY_DN5668_c0_g1_i1:1152-2846(-)